MPASYPPPKYSCSATGMQTSSDQTPQTVKAVVLTPNQAKLKKQSIWVATCLRVPVIGEALFLNELVLTDIYVSLWGPFADKVSDLKPDSLIIFASNHYEFGMAKPIVMSAMEKNSLLLAGRTMSNANAFVNKHLMALRNDATYYQMDEGMNNFFHMEWPVLNKFSKLSPGLS